MFPHLIREFTHLTFSKEMILFNQDSNEEDLDMKYRNMAFTLGSYILPKQMIKSFTYNSKLFIKRNKDYDITRDFYGYLDSSLTLDEKK